MFILDDISRSDLTKLIGHIRPTVLVGSGISLWHPTSLPTGQDFTKGVIQAVFKTSIGKLKDISGNFVLLDKLLENLPFEMLLERCPEQNKIKSLLISLYGSKNPNPIHNVLASMVVDGTIESIITTNYDLALDSAFANFAAPISKVVLESHKHNPTDRVFFKVHGSTDESDSVIYSLRLESRLPRWKRQILSHCINNRPLIIIGYSGLDFELCPEISLLNPSVIVWNYFSKEDIDKPGSKYLFKHGITPKPVLGDMTRLFNLLGYPIPTLTRSVVSHDVAGMILHHFTVEELLLWRVRLLNTMGFCRMASEALDPLITISYPEAGIECGQILFQMGLFNQAGEQFLKVISKHRDERERILSLLDASDCYRCYGNWILSYKIIRQAEKMFYSQKNNEATIQSRISMKKLLLLQEFVYFLPSTSFMLKRFGTYLVNTGAKSSLESGEWLAFQQFMLVAERLKIETLTFKDIDYYIPHRSADGYRHLGYKIGELLSLLERTRKFDIPVNYSELLDAIRVSVQLGNYPTAWKIAARIKKRFPRHSNKYNRLHLYYLNKCEYTRFKRLIYKRAS